MAGRNKTHPEMGFKNHEVTLGVSGLQRLSISNKSVVIGESPQQTDFSREEQRLFCF